jgi:hypothetical protein
MTDQFACIQPDQVHEADYLAALNQDSRPEFERHLAECQFCRSELQVYRQLDTRLRRQFEFISSPARTLCPEAHRAGEYALGLMSPVESSKLRQHLAQCPHCTEESEEIRRWLLEPDSWLDDHKKANRPPDQSDWLAPDRTDWLHRVVATLLKSSTTAPAYTQAGVRGSAEGLPLTFQAEEVTIVLTVQGVGPRTKALNILGLVQTEAGSPEDLFGSEVRLLSQGQSLASERLDELGNFFFENVQPPQPFELEITLASKIVMVPDLKLI